MMLCGATLFGAKRARFAGVPTHSPPDNAGEYVAAYLGKPRSPRPRWSICQAAYCRASTIPGSLKARVLFYLHVTGLAI